MSYNSIFIVISVIRTFRFRICIKSVCIILVHGYHTVIAVIFFVIYVIYTSVA